jgi:hypothetical protein
MQQTSPRTYAVGPAAETGPTSSEEVHASALDIDDRERAFETLSAFKPAG